MLLYVLLTILSVQSTPLIKILAVIGNTAITNIDLANFKKRLVAREKTLNITSKKDPLEIMIEETILTKYTKEKNLFPNDEDIENFISKRIKSMHLTRYEFIKYIQRNGYTEETFKQDLKVQKAKAALIEKELRNRISISKEELKQAYAKISSEPIETISYDLKMKASQLPCGPADLSKADTLSFLDTELQGWLKNAIQGLSKNDIKQVTHNNECISIQLIDKKTITNPNFEKLRDKLYREILVKKIDQEFDNWIKQKKKEYGVG